MVRLGMLLLIVYAMVGLLVSLAVHVLSYTGAPSGADALFFALHVGVFPLWIPVCLITRKQARGNQDSVNWEVTLAGAPVWMRYVCYAFFWYALINFLIFLASAPAGKQIPGPTPPIVWRGFSGHWMAFYAIGLSVVVAAYNRRRSVRSRRVSNESRDF
jgi:hypothetical protein